MNAMKPWISGNSPLPLNMTLASEPAPVTINDPRAAMCPAGLHGLVAPQRIVVETKNGVLHAYTLSEDRPNPDTQKNPDGKALARVLRLFRTRRDPMTGLEKERRFDVDEIRQALVPGMEGDLTDKIKQFKLDVAKRAQELNKLVKAGKMTKEQANEDMKNWAESKQSEIEGYDEFEKKFGQIMSGRDLPASEKEIQAILVGHDAHGFSLCYLPEDEKSQADKVESLRWYLSLYDPRQDRLCAGEGDANLPPLYDPNDETGRATLKLPQVRWFTFAAEAGLATTAISERGGEWCLVNAGERNADGQNLYSMHVSQQVQVNSKRAKGIGTLLSGIPAKDFKYEMDVSIHPGAEHFTRFLTEDETQLLAPSWVTFLEPLLNGEDERKNTKEARDSGTLAALIGTGVGVFSTAAMAGFGYVSWLSYKFMKDQAGGELNPKDYSSDLTEKAKEKGFSHLQGMEDIQDKMVEATLDPEMPHIIRSGAAGSGKSESIHEFFHRVATGQIHHLKGYRLWSLSGNALEAAGAIYAGKSAKALKKFLDTAAEEPTIIWVKEAHQLLDIGKHSGNKDTGAIERLKEILEKRDSKIFFIFDTNMPEQLMADDAFERRTTEVKNREYKYEEARAAVAGKAQLYESQHNVKIQPEAIDVATRLGDYKGGAVPSSLITIIRMATRRSLYQAKQSGSDTPLEVTKAAVIALMADDLGRSPKELNELFEAAKKQDKILTAAEVKAGRISHDEKVPAAKEQAIQEPLSTERDPVRVLESLEPMLRHHFGDVMPDRATRLNAVILLMDSGWDIGEVQARIVSLLKAAQSYAKAQKKPEPLNALHVHHVWQSWREVEQIRATQRRAIRHFLSSHSDPQVRAYWEARGDASRHMIVEDAMTSLGEVNLTPEVLEDKLTEFADQMIRKAPVVVEAGYREEGAYSDLLQKALSYRPDLSGIRAVLESEKLGTHFETAGLHAAETLGDLINIAAKGDETRAHELRLQAEAWMVEMLQHDKTLDESNVGEALTARFVPDQLNRQGAILEKNVEGRHVLEARIRNEALGSESAKVVRRSNGNGMDTARKKAFEKHSARRRRRISFN